MSLLEKLEKDPLVPQSELTVTAPGQDTLLPEPIPADRLERVESWGMNTSVLAYVYRPTTADGICDVFTLAKRNGLKVALRGGGCSYGDAALIAENIVLDLSRMCRILDWDPKSGIISIEPGVTLRQLWQYVIGDGWWPPVVSGTMAVTMGGAAGMNYHGKNNFKMGPIGNHILEFEMVTPKGEVLVCSRSQNTDLFLAAIGGFGMLGCFTRITLKMKKVESGLLKVYAYSTKSFGEIIKDFAEKRERADYLVGWIDCFPGGKNLGRGLVHEAYYLHGEEDPAPEQTLRIENQELPDTIMGLFPKSIVWRFLKPFARPLGMRLINAAKYFAGNTLGNRKWEKQSHAGFAFLLDYVPNWKWAYKPGGLIQYQSFIPAETAEACYTKQIQICHEWGIIPMLGVFKRHKKDDFLMSHAVDGYSLALDFLVSKRNRDRLWKLAARLNEVVLESGGRFYFAKDSTLDSKTAEAYLGKEAIDRFFALKTQHDPEYILQTGLARRLFGDRLQSQS